MPVKYYKRGTEYYIDVEVSNELGTDGIGWRRFYSQDIRWAKQALYVIKCYKKCTEYCIDVQTLYWNIIWECCKFELGMVSELSRPC